MRVNLSHTFIQMDTYIHTHTHIHTYIHTYRVILEIYDKDSNDALNFDEFDSMMRSLVPRCVSIYVYMYIYIYIYIYICI